MHMCLRAIDKTTVMIHSTYMAKDMTLESIIQGNRVQRSDLSHLVVTLEETTIKPQTSGAAVMKTDHNHHIKRQRL